MWNEIRQASLFRAKERPIHATTELKHTERGTQHFSNYSTPTYAVVVLFVVNQRSKLHTYSAEVPVLHTPVVEVRFSIKCCFVDGERAPPLYHVQVAAVRAAWHES